jgi:hypothetical protein
MSQTEADSEMEYQQIMSMEMLELNQLDTMIQTYYKKDGTDLDMFDLILQQLVMQAMMLQSEQELQVIREMRNFDRILADYERKATAKEFPATKFMIYMHFAIFYLQTPKLIVDLLHYGADEVFYKIAWMDRIALLEAMNKFEVPFADKYT